MSACTCEAFGHCQVCEPQRQAQLGVSELGLSCWLSDGWEERETVDGTDHNLNATG